jgi:manganese/zinc/iron transport system substrate-binding protein
MTRSICLLFAAILFFFSSCFSPSDAQSVWFSDNGKVKVLCTTHMIQDLVQGIGGDLVDCLTLIPGESDPHSYQLVKGDDEKLKRADIIFYNGLGLEHGPSLTQVLKKNPKAHAVGDYIRKVKPKDIVFIDKTPDPHVWMDVALWKEAIPHILEILSRALPQRVEQLQNGARTLELNLEMVDAEILSRLSSIPQSQRYLVTTHDAFNYFARAYLCQKKELRKDLWKERVQAPEGLAPDSQLSTADIKRLVDHIIRYGISVIFTEANVNYDSIYKIADAARKKGHFVEIAQKHLYADSLGPTGSGAETYQSMMRYNSIVISDSLRRLQSMSHT